MRKEIVKTVLSMLLIAVAVCGFSVSAHAISGEMAGSTLLYTYYDVRSKAAGGLGLTDNYFTVTNTATDRWVQAHVRVRTGNKSIELLDFDILLSPTDVFAFDLYDDNGATVFASCDTKTLIASGFTPNFDRDNDGTNDCFVLDSTTFPYMLSLIRECDSTATSTEAALAQTKKGYVEIIAEGAILANNWYGLPTDRSKDRCWGLDASENDDDVTIAGKMLDHTDPDLRLCSTSNGNGLCPESCAFATSLIGRVYYATVSRGPVVTRMAQLNAEVIDTVSPMIFHKESYDAELADIDCVGVDASDGCYAYNAPKATAGSVEGADDMNYCLYTDKIIPSGGTDLTGVRNKFGAAATFGPTLADVFSYRDGTLSMTTGFLNALSTFLSTGYFTENGLVVGYVPKTFADSHYFSVPSPNPFDMRTSFAFIFPLQHFIGEKDYLTVAAIYDNEENKTTTPIDKFISPGLPTITQPGDEASLFNLTAPFAEGWIRFAPKATNSTSATACNPGSAPCLNQTYVLVAGGSASYLPAYTGAVFTQGADMISVSHFQYSNLHFE